MNFISHKEDPLAEFARYLLVAYKGPVDGKRPEEWLMATNYLQVMGEFGEYAKAMGLSQHDDVWFLDEEVA